MPLPFVQQHLLAPTGSFRRRLPPTPLDLANGRNSGSHETLAGEEEGGLSRRTSSPRVLPTPPPQHGTTAFSPTSQSSTTSPVRFMGKNEMLLEILGKNDRKTRKILIFVEKTLKLPKGIEGKVNNHSEVYAGLINLFKLVISSRYII